MPLATTTVLTRVRRRRDCRSLLAAAACLTYCGTFYLFLTSGGGHNDADDADVDRLDFDAVYIDTVSAYTVEADFVRRPPSSSEPTSVRNAIPALPMRSPSFHSVEMDLARFDHSKMVFMKIPKTGTSSLGDMFGAVAARNGARWRFCAMEFAGMHYKEKLLDHFISSAFTTECKGKLFPEEEDRDDEPARFGFGGHLRFVDFEVFGRTNPIWVTQVREPVSKFVSMYRWKRRQWWTGRGSNGQAVDECVEKGLEKCDPEAFGKDSKDNIAFLCGVEPFCRVQGSPEALKTAKENVERFFPVVGVLEDINVTLAVLEDAFPDFFGGLSEFANAVHHDNAAPEPAEPLKPSTLSRLEKAFRNDIEFYHYLRQRLRRQYDQTMARYSWK